MGTLYFVLKNGVITLILVSVMQIKWGTQTFESRFMNYIRQTLAPQLLGQEKNATLEKFKVSGSDISKLKERIKSSPAFKEVSQSTKELLLEEVKEVLKKDNPE